MGATVEYAASELQPSEAQNGTNPVIAGRAFKGTIVLTATYADADVTLAIRLFSGSGATLGIDVRRLQIGSSPTGTGGAGLPAEAERTRLAILRAVRAGNYSKLQPLIPPKGFTFTTGRQSNPIGYWKTKGFDPLHVMGELLRMPYAIAYSGTKITYVWPSLFETTAKQKARLSPALKAKLAYIYPDIDKELRRWMGPNGYTGWRLGIESDGTWVFFVTND